MLGSAVVEARNYALQLPKTAEKRAKSLEIKYTRSGLPAKTRREADFAHQNSN